MENYKFHTAIKPSLKRPTTFTLSVLLSAVQVLSIIIYLSTSTPALAGGLGGLGGFGGGDGGNGNQETTAPTDGGAGGGLGSFGGTAGAGPGDDGGFGSQGGGGGGGSYGALIGTSGGNSQAFTGGHGGNGGHGQSGFGGGGGGGGGDGVVFTNTGSLTNYNSLTGGHGGNGGNSDSGEAGEGGGGGNGIVFTNTGTLINHSNLTGGNGGARGVGSIPGDGGVGSGGDGIVFMSNNNSLNHTQGSITGGNGSQGGIGIHSTGDGTTIITSSDISGGLSGDGTRASAIVFNGTGNTLKLENGYSITGNVICNDNNDNTLVLAGNSNTDFDISKIVSSETPGNSEFIGFDTFQKMGSSTWTLTGATNQGTIWRVDEGEIKLNGSLNSSHVMVANAGRLSGVGSMMHLTSAGRTSPGNSIGTLHITNDLTFNTTHVYQCEVSAAGQSDLIKVGGTANLDGSVLVIPSGGDFQKNKVYKYLILSAAVINGEFREVTSESNLYTFSLGHQDNEVYLILQKIAGLADLVKAANLESTSSAYSVARALDDITEHQDTLSQAYNALGNLSGQTLSDSLNSLTPASTITATNAIAVHTLDNAKSIIGNRLSTPLPRTQEYSQFHNLVTKVHTTVNSMLSHMFDKPKMATNTNASMEIVPAKSSLPDSLRTDIGQAALWLNSGVQTLNVGQINRPGTFVPELNTITGRTQIGGEYNFTDKLMLGAFAGYGRMSYKHRNGYSNGKINSYEIGTYGSYTLAPQWYMDAIISYAYNRLSGSRTIDMPGLSAKPYQKHHAHQYMGMVETGYGLKLAQAFTLTPFIGAGIVCLDESSYTETGADTLGLRVKGQSRTHLQSHTGLQLSKLFMTDKIQYYGFVKLAYTYRKGIGTSNKVTSSFIGQPSNFTVLTGKQTHNMFSPGIGVTALFDKSFYITLAYNADFGKYQRTQEGFLKIGKNL